MPSSGEPFNGALKNPAPLVAASRVLAERGTFGLVWLHEDLVVGATFGRIASFVSIGEPVTESLYALVGLEDDILKLRARAGELLDLPDVALVSADGAGTRCSLSVFWSADEHMFVVLMSRPGTQSHLEMDLVRQMRARLMAEAEVSAKSRALERVNAELARANADLESFASIISHDLQSPMRALRYKLDDLEGAIGPRQSEPVSQMLAELRAQSRRITGMLNALLEYSSAMQKSDVLEMVDTRRLADGIVGSLRVPPNFHVKIAGDWPILKTLAAPLDLVLRNLIDNALKHHDMDRGLIRLSAEPDVDIVRFVVADDGPGIRAEHHEAVFLPFRRLQSAQGRAGHGMGLAIVRRTLEGVGGSIAVACAAPETRGTVFIISWPRTLKTDEANGDET